MTEDPERPIQRPKDREAQQAHYSGKKKQHTVKNNLLMNVNSKVVLFRAIQLSVRLHRSKGK